MLILLDIGNTSVTYGLYEGGRLQRFGSSLFNEIPKLIKNCSKKGAKYKIDLVISSVVPKKTAILKKQFGKKKAFNLWVIGENIPTLIKHRYHPAKNLGADRIVNIYGALRIYGAPFLIIDYGTAITFDYVSKKRVFEGGMIVPGPEISFQALIERAAQLPKKVRLPEGTSHFLGRNTYPCMESGILQGYGALTDGLIRRFKSRFGPLKVIATGGFAQHLRPFCKELEVVDPKHAIKSLLLIFKDFQRRRATRRP
jgi:type III pantothenate kinase